MRKHIQVFSPHFDDAVLSVGQHMLDWLHQGLSVEVVTVFSTFNGVDISADGRRLIDESNSESAEVYAHARMTEDTEAMKKIGVQHTWLGFVDGGFRVQGKKPVYANFDLLFKGEILDDLNWLAILKKQLEKALREDAVVVVPLGVGMHADHLIVRDLLSQIASKKQLHFYVDIPYAFKFQHWQKGQILQLLKDHCSWKWSSRAKLEVVKEYSSQVPILFTEGLWDYPEVVIGERIT